MSQPTRLGAAIALASVLAASPGSARDVYKPYLDPAIPRHAAVLDTLKKLEANPNDAGLRNDLGCLVAQDGFWRDALREFEEAAKLDEKDSRPLFNAGLVKVWKGEWSSASRAFGKATRRDPGNWPAWWMKGFCEELLGNDDAAVAAYKVSLRVDTSLFDVERNPFAARSRLKGRALLESYPKRLAQASLPPTQQLTDAERVSAFLQPSARAKAAASPTPAPADEASGVGLGPIITSPPASTTSAPPARPGAHPGVKPLPSRGRVEAPPAEGSGERRLTQEDLEKAEAEMNPTPAPPPPQPPGAPGETAATPATEPGPGGFGSAPSRRRVTPTPEPK